MLISLIFFAICSYKQMKISHLYQKFDNSLLIRYLKESEYNAKVYICVHVNKLRSLEFLFSNVLETFILLKFSRGYVTVEDKYALHFIF